MRDQNEDKGWNYYRSLIKKPALDYYPKLSELEARIGRITLYICVPAGFLAILLSLNYQWAYSPGQIAFVTFLTYAAIRFPTKGLFGIRAGIALCFDTKRQDKLWSWEHAVIGLAYDILCTLIGLGWLVWLCLMATGKKFL